MGLRKKEMPGGKGRVPYLLRMAFKEAGEGDPDAAWKLWHEAIAEGYRPRPFMQKLLEEDIRKGELAAKDSVI